ncbi:MAG: Cytosol aminopeptidase [Phycisphaerae bacterium]|nr:Cytosol aminopeptidase [Phycisphaerae bacterium]
MLVSLEALAGAKGKAKFWVLPVFEGDQILLRKYDVEKTAKAWGFSGKKGQAAAVTASSGQPILLVGAGSRKELSAEGVRVLIAKSITHGALQSAQPANVLFIAAGLQAETIPTEHLVEALAEGAVLGSYTFNRFKAKGTEKDALPFTPARWMVALDKVRALDRQRFAAGLTMAKWTNWGRDLLNQSQSHITATRLAEAARRAAAQFRGVRCAILGRREIEKLKMGLLLAVNQGSSEPPRFIELHYSGGRKGDAPICLIGKGLTYDTGGYNLKPGDSMKDMHMDKGGAIGVLATFFAAVELKVKKNLICLVPSTDNRIGGNAFVAGDVFVGLGGISVEIDNTDAEGRLVLADALAYAARFKPSHIVDMATLTGAAVVALGDEASALFSNDDALANGILQHAEPAGELLWRMPLWDKYNDKIKSNVADIKNAGDRWGGAITAALFLKRFVPEKSRWAHIDMAGKMKVRPGFPYAPAGLGHGFGPLLLARWLREL